MRIPQALRRFRLPRLPCMVLDGKIVRGGKLRIYRDDILIVEGGVKQLKRFKDDVKEVTAL